MRQGGICHRSGGGVGVSILCVGTLIDSGRDIVRMLAACDGVAHHHSGDGVGRRELVRRGTDRLRLHHRLEDGVWGILVVCFGTLVDSDHANVGGGVDAPWSYVSTLIGHGHAIVRKMAFFWVTHHRPEGGVVAS